MRLLLVELDRFRSRRAIVLMLLAAAALTAVLAATTIWETRPVGAAEIAAAEQQAANEAKQPYVAQELRRCERKPQQYMGPEGDAADCEEMLLPQAEWFLQRSPLSLKEESQDSGLAVILFSCAAMIIVGTTFAGGDWASGSMSNQLLFEPRRLKVWTAKAVAATIGTLIASAVIIAGFWLALYLAAEMRDIPTSAKATGTIGWTATRGVLLAAFGGLGGYALTMLLRHTVGTLAFMFAYAVGGEALTAALPISRAGRWSLANNVFAWLSDGTTYWDESIPCSDQGMCDQSVRLSLEQGVAYLGALLLIVVVLSLFFFRRRDIA